MILTFSATGLPRIINVSLTIFEIFDNKPFFHGSNDKKQFHFRFDDMDITDFHQ